MVDCNDNFARARSVLIAPAVRADFLEKLAKRGADVVFIDCEDAVPAANKAEARRLAAAATDTLSASGCNVVVRVNATDSVWFNDDVAALSSAVSAVVVPKVETVEQVDHIAAALDAAGQPKVAVVAGLETAAGVLEARQILAHHRVAAAYFGAEDLIADVGGRRTESNAEVAAARAMTSLAAAAAGKPVWDQVVTEFNNSDRFVREATEAANMGYRGKLCIHPTQVALANEAFAPSAEEQDRARRLLDAYERAVASGVAAIDFEGQMVDEPLAEQARRLLDRASDGGR